MGLDVTAYRKLSPAANQTVDADGDYEAENVTKFSPNDSGFPGRADDIDVSVVYAYEDVMDVWSSGYGGYNRWREQLAKLAGYLATDHRDHFTQQIEKLHAAAAWNATKGPFWELINFTDCDGHIGTAISKKLAADFAAHQAAADAHPGERFRKGYAEWRAGFDFAADGGAVRFH